MKRFISDCHFYDKDAITKYDRKNFKSVDEMNTYMVKQWNDTIKSGDITIVLGDMFDTDDPNKVNRILNRLNGKICLIVGNHDHTWLNVPGVNLDRFEWIEHYKEIKDKENMIVLCHYPIFCYNYQYMKGRDSGEATATPLHYRGYMLYGHVHQSQDNEIVEQLKSIMKSYDRLDGSGKVPCQMINCYCVDSDYRPLTLYEWIDLKK